MAAIIKEEKMIGSNWVDSLKIVVSNFLFLIVGNFLKITHEKFVKSTAALHH